MATEFMDNAKREKADEFYTQLSDIEAELRHYKAYFKDKIVLCNCDDPYESNFFKYFAINFNHLKIKKLIATCYDSSPVAFTQLSLFDCGKTFPNKNRKAYKIEISEVNDFNADGAVDFADVKYLLQNEENTLTLLKGNGDFRSDECVELLKQADIVVTNPPFSLFREYVAQLMKYNKKFLIIGNQNALTYKEIFRFMKENTLWLGYKFGDMKFRVPDYYEARTTRFWIDQYGKKWRSLGNICWYTNLDTTKRHEFLTLYKRYTPEEYPKYDNYNAINVNKYSEIPYDYDGCMGVPITFLDKYNPAQFEILGLAASAGYNADIVGIPFEGEKDARPLLGGKNTYARIFVRRKNVNEN